MKQHFASLRQNLSTDNMRHKSHSSLETCFSKALKTATYIWKYHEGAQMHQTQYVLKQQGRDVITSQQGDMNTDKTCMHCKYVSSANNNNSSCLSI